jgi:hypothetical protein
MHADLEANCMQSLGADYVTALMFADPGDFSGSAEAKYILANLQDKVQVPPGSTVCGNRFTGKLLGQDVAVITTGACWGAAAAAAAAALAGAGAGSGPMLEAVQHCSSTWASFHAPARQPAAAWRRGRQLAWARLPAARAAARPRPVTMGSDGATQGLRACVHAVPPTDPSAAGIGDTAAGLCAYEVLLTCGAHVKEIIYFGTSGWSPAQGGLLDADRCDQPNKQPLAARCGGELSAWLLLTVPRRLSSLQRRAADRGGRPSFPAAGLQGGHAGGLRG